jgi:hypothetical protein
MQPGLRMRCHSGLRRGFGVSHTVAMRRVVGSARLVVAAAIVVAVALGGGLASRRAAGATTRVVDRSDARFDVLVQRRTQRLGGAGAEVYPPELKPPDGQPRLSAAQAWSAAGAQRQPNGRKPSVRLATFVDTDIPLPVGPNRQPVPVTTRALVWVVVVPDVPQLDSGPDVGAGNRPARPACPTYTPVDASTGEQLGTWHYC